jgi:hypothetical protein
LYYPIVEFANDKLKDLISKNYKYLIITFLIAKMLGSEITSAIQGNNEYSRW